MGDKDKSKARRLLEIDAGEASLVDRPANGRKLLVVKRQNREEDTVPDKTEEQNSTSQEQPSNEPEAPETSTDDSEETPSTEEAQAPVSKDVLEQLQKSRDTIDELVVSLTKASDPLGQEDAVSKALAGFEEHRAALELLGVTKSETPEESEVSKMRKTIADLQEQVAKAEKPAEEPAPKESVVTKAEFNELVNTLNSTFEKMSEVVKSMSARVESVESMHPVSKAKSGGEASETETAEVEKSQAQKLFGGLFAGID